MAACTGRTTLDWALAHVNTMLHLAEREIVFCGERTALQLAVLYCELRRRDLSKRCRRHDPAMRTRAQLEWEANTTDEDTVNLAKTKLQRIIIASGLSDHILGGAVFLESSRNYPLAAAGEAVPAKKNAAVDDLVETLTRS